jgi:hypothetical protein
MKKYFLSIFVTVLLASCQDKKAETFDVNLLNGYWEIEQVTMADGSKKEYKMNETIDFFEVKSDSGFRKKVTPQFDGTYLVNDSDEKFKIEKSAEGMFISYKTAYATWKEEIITLSNDKLILENKQNIQYQYKKPTPFTVK